MGCAIGMVKYLVFIFNLVFALAGLALLIIGVLFKINADDYTQVIEEQDTNFAVAPTLLIVIGSIIFIISFFGCCGAIKESTCMLTTYAVILLVVFILQVAIGVFAFLQVKDMNDVNKAIKEGLNKSFSKYGQDDVITDGFNLMQKNVKCCGVEGPGDYNWGNGTVPISCCEEGSTECTPATAFSVGCAAGVSDVVDKSITTIGYVACGLAAVEIIGAIFALCLSSSIRNQSRRSPYA